MLLRQGLTPGQACATRAIGYRQAMEALQHWQVDPTAATPAALVRRDSLPLLLWLVQGLTAALLTALMGRDSAGSAAVKSGHWHFSTNANSPGEQLQRCVCLSAALNVRLWTC